MGPQSEGGPSGNQQTTLPLRPAGEGRNPGVQQYPEDNRRYQDRDVHQDQRLPRPNGGFASENRSGGSPSGSANGRDRDRDLELPRQSGEARNQSRTRNNGRMSSGQTREVRACKKCGEPLTGQFVRALGGTYHLDCFRCEVSKDCYPAREEPLTNISCRTVDKL